MVLALIGGLRVVVVVMAGFLIGYDIFLELEEGRGQ
jgi:hypothetical protein